MKNEIGAFIPTTQIWDPAVIQEVDVNSEQFKDLIIKLYQNINNIVQLLNKKDTGIYDLNEFVCGQVFFSNPSYDSTSAKNATLRQVFRKVINFGALNNAAGTTSVAHGISVTTNYNFTRIYGVANDTTGNSYLPIPYASGTAASIIELYVDATNVYITVGQDRSSYNAVIILEYIKD